ncbi:hypothetical protein ACOSQ4_008383 [Xanthoceras sorbifolium]
MDLFDWICIDCRPSTFAQDMTLEVGIFQGEGIFKLSELYVDIVYQTHQICLSDTLGGYIQDYNNCTTSFIREYDLH